MGPSASNDHQRRIPVVPRDGSGDGWVYGPEGQRFWGRYGAAGLLLTNPAGRILLQHRVEWSHFGGTWGVPGGARHRGEAATSAAVREAREEAGIETDRLELCFVSVLELGWWSYSTVAARTTADFEPRVTDPESLEVEWVAPGDVESRPLHPGFAASWPMLRRELARRPRVIVDAANVVGVRPDGWWKDRGSAARRLLTRLDAARAQGLPADLLGLPLAAWWPDVTVVLEGRAAAETGIETVSDLVRAPGEGDETILSEARRARAAGEEALVVTSDRELADAVIRLGARVISSRSFRDAIDPEGEGRRAD